MNQNVNKRLHSIEARLVGMASDETPADLSELTDEELLVLEKLFDSATARAVDAGLAQGEVTGEDLAILSAAERATYHACVARVQAKRQNIHA